MTAFDKVREATIEIYNYLKDFQCKWVLVGKNLNNLYKILEVNDNGVRLIEIGYDIHGEPYYDYRIYFDLDYRIMQFEYIKILSTAEEVRSELNKYNFIIKDGVNVLDDKFNLSDLINNNKLEF